MNPNKNNVTVLEIIKNNHPNKLVPWYFMACYAYYQCDVSIISDYIFSDICDYLYDKWDDVYHIDKHLINKTNLMYETGKYLKETDYPNSIKNEVMNMILSLDADADIVQEQESYYGTYYKSTTELMTDVVIAPSKPARSYIIPNFIGN